MQTSKQLRSVVLMAWLALCLPAAGWAQQKDPRVNPPVAPTDSSSRAPETKVASPEAAATPTAQPDTRPVNGIEELGLGSLNGGRSFVVFKLRVSQGFDTNTQNAPGARNFSYQTDLRGSVELQRVTGRHTLSAIYGGGGMVYSDRTGGTRPVHSFTVSDAIQGRRWSLLVNNAFSFLPEAAFGLGGFAGAHGPLPGQLLGSGVTVDQGTLNPTLVPNQTIFSQPANRISNTVAAQVQYAVSPHLSFNAGGSYGKLMFLEDGFIDSSNSTFRTGFSYRLQGGSAVGVSYSWSGARFEGTTRAFDGHNLHFTYSRRLTGRLALVATGGPMISTFQNPVTGSGKRVTWTVGSTLRYALQDSRLNLTYYRTLTGGSGLLLGAQSDVVNVTWGRQLTRMWNFGLDFGYAHNSSLRELNTGGTANARFNSYRSAVSFSRPVGRHGNLFVGYGVSYQNSSGCTATTICGNLLRHNFSIGFDWQSRPYLLE